MKFNLSKTKYSRGGLYLGRIVAIPLISSYSYAGLVGTELETEEDLHHFTLCLEFKSNVAYKLNQEKCANWIKEDLYKESIYNVISNAIADCVLERNEFAKNKVKDGVVLFGATPKKIKYTAENWNAVVLYNLIYFISQHQNDANITDDKIMDVFYKEYIYNKEGKANKANKAKLGTKFKTKYEHSYTKEIKRAYEDIEAYNKELDIVGYMRNKTKFDAIYKGSRVCENYDENGLAKIKIMSKQLYNSFTYKYNGKIKQNANINIYIEEGKIKSAKLYDDKSMIGVSKIDDYMNIEYISLPENKYKYPKADEENTKKIQEIVNYNTKYSNIVESEETIDGKEKRLYDIIDVGWYTDKNGQGHIAWLDVDDAYLDKAYYTYNDKKNNDKKMTATLNIPDGVFLDKKCFKDMTIPYIDKDDKMFSIGIENDANAVAMLSENSEYMIADSHSITSVYLGLCANSKSSKIASMISNNDRLGDVSIGIESPKNTLTRCESLICHNESLSSAKVTIWSENLKSLEAIVKGTPKLTTAKIYISSKSVQSLSNLVDEQPNLEEILIDLENKTQNLKEMQNIFTRCPKLSEVVYIATTDSETGEDFIRTEYKLGEDNSIRIKKGNMVKYHSPKEYTDVSFYKDNETYKEENGSVDSADDDY